MKTRYTFTPIEAPTDFFKDELLHGISPECINILYKRGLHSIEEIKDFLFPPMGTLLETRLEMKDSKIACEILRNAIDQKDLICVYHDYDADGCSAAAIMLDSLTALGARVILYVNQRDEDGYGICKNGIDRILTNHPDTKIILTVDNGIVANEAIQYGKDKGLTMVVTDHHEPSEKLPAADAVVDPKRADETYPFHDFCGAGVAFKLMLQLYRMVGKTTEPVLKTIDLAALATVADIVPLVGENRAIVKLGLQKIDSGTRPFFSELRKLISATNITAHYTIGFQYAPMVNSFCRMEEDVSLIPEAMCSDQTERLTEIVHKMKEVNEARKAETEREVEIAMQMLEHEQIGTSLILYNEEFQEGIVGIVAGRLKSEYNRPVIVFAKGKDGVLKASGRSIPEVALKETLDKIAEAHPDLLLGYGGHKLAAGLSVQEEKLNEFSEVFRKETDALLADHDYTLLIELDSVISAEELTEDFIHDLRMLEPFGEGFRRPLFGLKASCTEVRYMGDNGQHVKFIDKKNDISVIQWNTGDKVRASGGRIKNKFIGHPELNEYKGFVNVQFICSDN